MVYATDDLYFEYFSNALQPSSNEKRCHPDKATVALREIQPFNGENPPKPSPIKLKRATDNAKINAILPGQLKSLPVFYDTSESTEVAEEVPESTDDDKDTSDQDLTILSPECHEMLVSDLMKEAELPNLSCNSLELELEKLDKEDVTSDPTTATISSTDITETAIKPQQETSPSDDKDEASVLRESLEEAFQTIHSLDEVQLSLAEEEVRGGNEDDEDGKAKCVYCEAVFKEDTSRRVWIGCDGPCKLWMHKTCIPKHQRPGHMRKTDKWMCYDCRVEK